MYRVSHQLVPVQGGGGGVCFHLLGLYLRTQKGFVLCTVHVILTNVFSQGVIMGWVHDFIKGNDNTEHT